MCQLYLDKVGGKTIISYVRSAWQQKWNANTVNHHDVSQIGFCQGFLWFSLGSFETKFKDLLVNTYEVRWLFTFLKIDSLRRITLFNAIHQTTSIYVCGCVCVCVKTMKLTFMSLQIIFKVNTQIIPNDEDMYATNKTVSFYQVFNNLLTPISRWATNLTNKLFLNIRSQNNWCC